MKIFTPHRMLAFLIGSVLLSGCATPVFKLATQPTSIAAIDVQQAPEQFHSAEIVWGGRIVAVENREDTTEVEVISYPLDRDQSPLTDAPTQGRFLLVLPGYVEAYDYPVGRHLSVHGQLIGTRVGRVQDYEYVFPLVRARQVHIWPWGFMLDRKPRVNIGIGVGIR
jgi:outer membrane lipoprotein